MLGFNKTRYKERGDTLIEVMFAITVFAFIVVSSLTLMSQGTSAAQRSLAITSIRQQMDGQAETLRFLHESYVEAYLPGVTSYTVGSAAEEYNQIIQHVKAGNRTSASAFGGTTSCTVPSDINKDFVLNPVSAKLVTNATRTGLFEQAIGFAQLTYTSTNAVDHSQGIWIEGVRSSTTTASAGYIDFHIRACWDAPGVSVPMNLGTIVRLYEPRG